MSSIYDLYEVSPELETEGVWVQMTDTLSIKVGGFGGEKYQAALEKFMGPYQTQKELGTLDAKVEEDVVCKAMATGIILDWEGMTDRENQPLDYSFDNAYALLIDPAMKRFKMGIASIAKEAETFKKQEKVKTTKNLQKRSSGKTKTPQKRKS